MGGDLSGHLYSLAQDRGGFFTPLLGAAGALISSSNAAGRWAGVALLCAGLSPVGAGSNAWLRARLNDPFAPSPSSKQIVADASKLGEPIKSASLTGEHWGLALAPSGGRFLTERARAHGHQSEHDHGAAGSVFEIGDFATSERHAIEAFRVAFQDDDHVIAVVERDRRMEAQRLALPPRGEPLAVWPLPALDPEDDFDLRASADGWEILAQRDKTRTLRYSAGPGSESGGEIQTARWSRSTSHPTWRVSANRESLLEREFLGPQRGPSGSRQRARWLFQRFHQEHALRIISANESIQIASTRLSVDLISSSAPGQPPLTLTWDREGASFWTLNVETGDVSHLLRAGAPRSWAWDGERLAVLETDRLWLQEAGAESRSVRRLENPADWSASVALGASHVAIRRPEGPPRVDLFALPF